MTNEKKMEPYPHCPAAFINAIWEEGTKQEAIEWLQRTWNELCAIRSDRDALREALDNFFEKFEQREQAYSFDVFPEVQFALIDPVLRTAGFSLDRVSASNFRWMVNSIAKDLAPIRAAIDSALGADGVG